MCWGAAPGPAPDPPRRRPRSAPAPVDFSRHRPRKKKASARLGDAAGAGGGAPSASPPRATGLPPPPALGGVVGREGFGLLPSARRPPPSPAPAALPRPPPRRLPASRDAPPRAVGFPPRSVRRLPPPRPPPDCPHPVPPARAPADRRRPPPSVAGGLGRGCPGLAGLGGDWGRAEVGGRGSRARRGGGLRPAGRRRRGRGAGWRGVVVVGGARNRWRRWRGGPAPSRAGSAEVFPGEWWRGGAVGVEARGVPRSGWRPEPAGPLRPSALHPPPSPGT